jgi:hypothetical protein
MEEELIAAAPACAFAVEKKRLRNILRLSKMRKSR